MARGCSECSTVLQLSTKWKQAEGSRKTGREQPVGNLGLGAGVEVGPLVRIA